MLVAGIGVAAAVTVPSMLKKGDATKTQTQTAIQVQKSSGEKGGVFDLKSKDNGRLTLKVKPSSKVELTIQSPRGKKPKFKKKWSTEEKLVLDNAFAGSYTIKSGDQALPTTIIELKKKGEKCEYLLDLPSDKEKWSKASWKMECK